MPIDNCFESIDQEMVELPFAHTSGNATSTDYPAAEERPFPESKSLFRNHSDTGGHHELEEFLFKFPLSNRAVEREPGEAPELIPDF